jgi:hypothetical protein
VRIGVRVNDPAALERAAAHLPPRSKPSQKTTVDELCSLLVGGNAPSAGVRRYNLLYWGSGKIARTLDRDEVFQALESLLHIVVAVRARRQLFVRAGVVGWQGRGLVICGPPSSGKTTLVEALIRAGATYYSDQYAVFDRHGRVQPYPHPLGRALRAERPALNVLPKPLPVGLVVVTQYQPGIRWRPRALSSAQAVLALLTHTVQARLRPAVALATLRRVVAEATTLKGKRGEVEDLVPPLLNRLCKQDHDDRMFETSPV